MNHSYDTIDPQFVEEGSYVVEHEGIEAAPIGIFIFALLVGLSLLVWGATGWIAAEVDTARTNVNAAARYPALHQTEIAASQRLHRYEALDAEQDIYRIPIDRAMELLVQEAPTTGSYTTELRMEQ